MTAIRGFGFVRPLRAGLILLVLTAASGCAERAHVESIDQANTPVADPVVIALLDTGVGPYLESFEVDDDSYVASGVPVPLTRVTLSREGPIEERRKNDDSVWEALELGRLYHFAGTGLLAIGFEPDAPLAVTEDYSAHGVMTSYMAAREAPRAIIVMVQISSGRECLRELRCIGVESIADGMEWIAAQEWIDIVSVSMATPANHPVPPATTSAVQRYLVASEEAARGGKLIINGAGNTFVPPFFGTQNGPPWILTVGGVEIESHGESVYASKGVDVVANYSDYGPRGTRGNMGRVGGTSIATPIVAGTLAHALHLVREAEPGRLVAPQELRDALNASARHEMPGVWKPVPPPGQGLPADPARLSLPVLAQPQMGWGYVDAALAPEIARRILEQDFSIPAGKDQARVFQPAWQQAREEFWSRYA